MVPPPPPPQLASSPSLLRLPLPSISIHEPAQHAHTTESPVWSALETVPRSTAATARVPQDPADGTTGTKKRSRQHGDRRETPLPLAAIVDETQAKKPAYVLQREEREDLDDYARALEAQIDALRLRVGLPTTDDHAAIDDVRALSFTIEEKLHQNNLFLGRLHSKVTNELMLPTVNPMSTFIHLPCEMAQRRAILRGMQELKLRRGLEVALERLHHLDPHAPYLSEEKFTSASGEYHYHRFMVTQFPNFRTVRQLYDAFVAFVYNIDVNVTDMFGQLAVREETEEIDTTVWNHRLITVADDVGVTEELNVVGFARFYEHAPQTQSPMGVVVYDTVNVDDLYPYVPEERTCKDFQSVDMMYELRKPGSKETVVVLKQCSFGVQLVPQFPLAANVLQRLQDNTARWPNAFIKFLRDVVVPDAATSSDSDEDDSQA